MILIPGIILAAILVFISFLHFYWAIGGKAGFVNSLPENKHGKKVLNPTKFDAMVVAVGLLAMALFILIRVSVFSIAVPNWIMKCGLWIIAGIFMLRAIGDFRYFGFFKTVKHSSFAKIDSHYYSPLCLLIGLTVIMIEVI